MKSIFGNSPITTIFGFIVAGLVAANALMETGVTDWKKLLVAAVIAIGGRITADSNNVTPTK